MPETKTMPPDTQAILLLCGHFGSKNAHRPKPLSLSEYHGLTVKLRHAGLRPGDLLDLEIQKQTQNIFPQKIAPERLTALLSRGVEMGIALEQWTRQGIWVLSRGDSSYPASLKSQLKETAPALIYGVGDRTILRTGGLGIVGSRDADETALRFTSALAQRCAEQDLPVISGGAPGIDRQAMQATLQAGGRVLGILPEGVSRVALAKANRDPLADGRLTLISICTPNARWSRGHAMGRNKYIYALSDWTVAVSSGNRGGTWSGAIESLQKGWGSLLVRDSPDAPSGNTQLLQRGAAPLNPEDALRAPSLRHYLEGQASLLRTNTVRAPLLFSAVGSEVREPESDVYDSTTATGSATTVAPPDESPAVPPEIADKPAQSASIDDLFEVVWPSLALAFISEVSDKELSELALSFHVQVGQLKAWVRRAVEDGRLEKRSKPIRYVLKKS